MKRRDERREGRIAVRLVLPELVNNRARARVLLDYRRWRDPFDVARWHEHEELLARLGSEWRALYGVYTMLIILNDGRQIHAEDAENAATPETREQAMVIDDAEHQRVLHAFTDMNATIKTLAKIAKAQVAEYVDIEEPAPILDA